ncbi:Mitochondrial ATPase complex subunit atp10 [Tieghemiomyces parasiticus]|uniref:Mitochondrial ATPase complex subunit atp10 n=1 Tax=Tieghemiomyces parasiticus TaxID=78921 RepID=A0A9W8A785_9FUNG|nr:Mitochondrial ATPase complex subunit atp10 [Tieghemiomyces parasiticus]
MSKRAANQLRERILERLPYSHLDEPAKREVTRSLQDISQSLKDRLKNFQPGTPLGQTTAPTPAPSVGWLHRLGASLRSTWDQEATLERRKYLVRKFQRPHFQDMLDLKKYGDKLFPAPTQLIPADRALYMPNLEARNLLGKPAQLVTLLRGRVSLVSFQFVKHAEEHVETYSKPFQAAFEGAVLTKEGRQAPPQQPPHGGHLEVQHVRINVVENWAKAAVVRPFLTSTLGQGLTDDEKRRFLCHFRPIDRMKDQLFIDNLAMGWVYLVDPDCKVRWYANGAARPEEINQLLRFTAGLARLPVPSPAVAAEGNAVKPPAPAKATAKTE